MTICAIHQPNFFPWSGYFNKIKKVDYFIFLDEVAYPKSGSGSGSWCNRVKLLNSGQPAWYGLPIKRSSGMQLIRDVRFADKDFHVNKLKKSLVLNYKRKQFFDEIITQIEPIIDYKTDELATYNINAITTLSKLFGFKTKFFRQSELQHSSHSTALLIELVKQVGADSYLCGNGASGYQEDELFAENGIQLIYQNYQARDDDFFTISHEYEEGLSVLNALFSYGFPIQHGLTV